MPVTQKAATNATKFSMMVQSKAGSTYNQSVLLQIASASKAVEYLRSIEDTSFVDYLQALATISKYESKRANDLGFVLNPDVPVNEVVIKLDFDKKGGLHGGNLLPQIKRYLVKNFAAKK